MQFLPKKGFENDEKLLSEHISSISDLSAYEQGRFIKFSSVHQTKSYIPVVGCVLKHIISATDLSSLEKLYYLIVESLACVNAAANKQRAVALSANKWAAKLNCSKSQVFAMQKKLAEQGYFIIEKDKNDNSQDKRNLIIPTLPDPVFEALQGNDDRTNIEGHLAYNPHSESKLAYLHRTKLFIRLNYRLLTLISSNAALNSAQKIIWLDFYARCYRGFISSGKDDFSFFTTYQEMMKRYGLTKSALSKILNKLVRESFIFKKQLFKKSETEINDRQDQSIWQIRLGLPTFLSLQLLATPDRKGLNLPDIYKDSLNNCIKPETDSRVVCGKPEEGQARRELTGELLDEFEDILDCKNSGKANNNKDTGSPESVISNKNLRNKTELVSCTDPHVANSGLYFNRNILSSIFKSNLEKNPEVTINDSYEKFKKQKSTKTKKDVEFNICSELIRQKLKILPRDKADKARKFAYSLVSRKLARGYAENLGKHELAKQLIFHAASWKPTEYSHLTRGDCIDVALAFAWKAIVNGTWQAPLGWVKAQTLQYEFEYYRQKYQETGVLSSYEITSIEGAVGSLLGSDYHGVLVYEITRSKEYHGNDGIPDTGTCRHCRKHGSEVSENMDNASYQPLNISGNMSGNIAAESISYSDTFLAGEDGLEEEHCYSEDHIVSRTDFSALSDEQRLCVLTTSGEDNSMILETAAKKQYLVKAKALETNSYGEMIIVLQTDPALVLGTNTSTCIDKALNSIKTIDVPDTCNDTDSIQSCLLQDKELTGRNMSEQLQKGCYGVPSMAQGIINNVKIPDTRSSIDNNKIDYSRLLDEE